ncbi:MAG: hypothetical protein MMC33_005392 [Icmadophila ericetorum]|nr:hypothetical protein [Icmadophila ericetorum]
MYSSQYPTHVLVKHDVKDLEAGGEKAGVRKIIKEEKGKGDKVGGEKVEGKKWKPVEKKMEAEADEETGNETEEET